MAVPYPSSPAVGDQFTYGGVVYTWNGVAWTFTVTNTPGSVGSVAVTAPITNSGTPTAPVIGISQGALTIAQSQVTNLVTDLAGKANLSGGNTFAGNQTFSNDITHNGFYQNFSNMLTSGRVTIGLSSLSSGVQLGVYSTSATNVGTIVRGAASQSANLQEWQNSSSTVLARIASTGQLLAPSIVGTAFQITSGGIFSNGTTSAPANVQAYFLSTAATNAGLVVRGASSQSADLLELQNNSGTDLLSVNASGGLLIGTTHLAGATPGLGQMRTSTNTGLNYVDTTANDSAGTGPGYTARRSRGTLAAPTQVQSGDLLFGIFAQGWHDAAGFGGNSAAIRLLANQNFTTTALGSSIVFETASDGTTGRVERMRVTGAGTLSVGTTSSLGQLGVQTSSASTLGLVVRGASAQTADLFLLQNNGGTTQFRVDPNGMTIANSLGVAGSPSGISYAYFTTPSASAKPVVVRGAASQTANLQEWQNSAGTVMGRINADGSVMFGNGNMSVSTVGSIFANAISTNVGRINMGEANSGGQLTITRQTAAATNPGANIARLYLRDGTDAGTLKLVVRAGASGAETTILDNIPQ